MPKTSAKPRAPKMRAVTADLIRDALAAIPADVDRDTWARVGMAVKASELAEDAAFDLWDQWSARGSSYSERGTRDTWRSIKAHGSVTVGTLFGIAKDHGFRFPPATGGDVQTSASTEATRLADEKRLKRAAEAEALAERQAEAAERCATLWAGASDVQPAMGAPYLKRKGVQAHGLRFLPGGVALVPMRDVDGRLWSVQQLLPKRLRDRETGEDLTDKLYGPPKLRQGERVSSRKTGLFHAIAWAADSAVVLIAEGYATAASLHEATGRPVVVAFDAGNLVHVVRALRERNPALPLLVCGDDDRTTQARTGKNPGRDKAAAAVKAAVTAEGRAAAVFPPAADAEGKDFNDLAQLAGAGADAVRECVEQAVSAMLAGPPMATRGQQTAKSGSGGPIDSAGGSEGGDGGNGPPGDAGGAPAGGGDPFGGGRDPFVLDDAGVWFIGRDREGQDKRPTWLCAPLYVTARTRADDGNGWGLLLQFSDPDGNAKTWAMPAAMLSGDGAEWAGRLRDMGLRMAPGGSARNLVAQYIDTRNPTDRATCTDRVGWHSSVFVLPSGSIGQAEGRSYVFQSEAGMEDAFRRHGALAQWRESVATLAVDNSRLVFALSCAFAGPTLRLAGMESGGFHLRGTSSMGKTTALKVAASVWGRPTYMQTWRSTTNALEATAVQHSDCTLILDELGQLDPREAGDCSYLLANDQEKGRNTRGGLNRKRRTWRLIFLSSGEISLADHMAEGGRRTQAGMEVRLVDVPLDAGAGMGGLEALHGHEGPAELAEAITGVAGRFYGTAGRSWLEWLCAHHATTGERLQKAIETHRTALVPEAASEQVRRVGSRFAMVAAAGELATEAGITGWVPGHALWGVRQCFNAWLGARGHLDNGEDEAMLRQVRAWLEKNGDALLTWTHRAMDDHKASTPLRAGFKRLTDMDGKPLKFDAAMDYIEKLSSAQASERREALVEFLILPETFRRYLCTGFTADAVANVLKKRGHLVHESGRLSTKQRLPGMGLARCYFIKPSIFTDEYESV